MLAEEDKRIAHGAAPRPGIVQYSAWRERTDEVIQVVFAFYGTYLVGQTNGMSDALSLPALVAAMDLDSVAKELRPRLAQLCLTVHAELMAIHRTREAMKR